MAIERVEFADTGTTVSAVCLGTMMFGGRTDEKESIELMHRALDAGIDFWDTAPMYSATLTESIVGKALAGRRDNVFLATKVHKGTSRLDILSSCDESLQRLNTDHVDLLQIHWPIEKMSLEEITRAMDELVKTGKVRYLGCCNFPAWVLAEVRHLVAQTERAKMVSLQPPYSLIERGIEVELLPMCLHESIAVIPYRPICMGVLSGKYHPGQPLPKDSRGQDDDRVSQMLEQFGPGIKALFTLAENHGVSVATIALAWVRAQPGITSPIVGVSRLAQLDELLKEIDFTLDQEQCDELATVFDSDVKEVALGSFPQWRRRFDTLADCTT